MRDLMAAVREFEANGQRVFSFHGMCPLMCGCLCEVDLCLKVPKDLRLGALSPEARVYWEDQFREELAHAAKTLPCWQHPKVEDFANGFLTRKEETCRS